MKIKITLFAAFLFCQISVAQEEKKDSTATNELSEVKVVTGTRTERVLSSLPLPMTVITSEAIAKTGVTRLNEILNEQTGIILIPDESGFEGVQMQGLDAAYTMILIDGVPLVGRSSGVLDLSRVSVGNIERIEIVKGASSALYGSEAMGGVINVITKRPKKDMFSGSLSYRYGTFNTNDANANLLWKKKKFAANLFANFYSSDGYDLDKSTPLQNVERYYNTTIQPKLYYDFSENLKLTVSNRFYNQNMNNVAIIESANYKGDAKENEWNSQIKLEHKWNSKFYSEYELYTTNYKNNAFLNDENNVLFENTYYNQWLFRPEARTTWSIKNDKLTGGIGLNYETLDRTYFDKNVNFNSQYVFLQYDFNPTDKINILAGFRYDSHSEYASQLSPKLAVNYKFNNNFSLKGSVGYGYKAPDFRQLFFDFTNPSVGYTVLGYNVAEDRLNQLDTQGQLLYRVEGISFNKPLEAESSVNFNFGTFYKKNKLRLDINAFYNSISNLIDTRVIAQKTNGQNVFSYFNISKIFTYGVEYNSTYDFTKEFSVSLGYQYLIAKDKSVIDNFEDYQYIRNDQLQTIQINKSDYFGLYNRSKHTANIKFDYNISKIKTDINLRIFYRSKYGMFDSNANQILDKYDQFVGDYFITNLSISKYITDKLILQAGANNLLDFTDPGEITNLAGRQLFARIQYNF
ncbi:TonB-dependent receptor plug domain-containing protein [Flavobacterium pectinovorum]|uniref:Outer membrane receptor for ferrienterochelin and colicins n=1 Tax=Flavobacterium pectinovorum TaxID=29533 RepID=A0AB36P707_9FLAO|nr:TonB-dependent receptor [Flavobacterium pectinovorum]OXB07683.1 TonB-dependent receptor [Flavobacterium pectinovorum]SHM76430.1 outer membrane receptor for ferrienterochelin and colicins [Flavobacterium pectinovorum]